MGVGTHRGYDQEAYDLEYVALSWELEEAARRHTVPERVTIFTDAQTAIQRLASEEPGPGQKYAIQARRHIAALRKARPGITIEIRWCPAHKGVPRNEKAGEWRSLRQMSQITGSEVAAGRPVPPETRCTPQAGDLREEVG